MSQTPTVGRIVHYTSRGSADGVFRPEPRAAIITAVHTSVSPNGEDYLGERQYADEHWSEYNGGYVRDEEVAEYIAGVDLAVLNPTGLFFDDQVPYAEEPTPGCWSWPPRVG
jgi:hypothetical protein